MSTLPVVFSGPDGVLRIPAQAPYDPDHLASLIAAKLKRPEAPQVSPRLLTVDQAATYLGRTKTAVQCLIADRALPTVRHDRRVFLDVKDLDGWIQEGKD